MTESRVPQVHAAARAALRRPDIALLAAACALIGAMYCTNSDWGGDPVSARGDGHYRPVLARGDGHLYYLMALSTVFDRDWWFDDELARFGDPWQARVTAAGRKGIPHPIGPALVWAPTLAVAGATAWVADRFGADIALHGYTGFHQRIVFATTVLFAWFSIAHGWRDARIWMGGVWGPALAAVAVLLGTPLTYYATYMPSYPHAMDAAFVAAFLHYWATTIGRRDVRRLATMGALLGAATLVRSQELALGIVVAVEVGAAALAIAPRAAAGKPGGSRRLASCASMVMLGAVTLAVALATFSVQIFEWHVVYGGWGQLPQGPRFLRFLHPFALEALFSSRNGWLSSTPIAGLGVVGLALVPRRHRLVGVGLLAAVLVQVYLCSVVFDWWASASFSQRRLTSMSYPLVIGLSALLGASARLVARAGVLYRSRHAIAVAALGWLVTWNLSLVFPLRGGRSAASQPRAAWDHAPPLLRSIAAPIHDFVGNPFALPAGAYFAARWGVPLNRWDEAVGLYPLVPPLDDLTDGSYVDNVRGNWDLGSEEMAPYLISGFGPSERAAAGSPVESLRWTDAASARALMPALMPDALRMRWWLMPSAAGRRVTARWNARVVIDEELGDRWNVVQFDVPEDAVRMGMNLLEIDAPLGPDGRGVAVAQMAVAFVPRRH